MRPVAIIPYFNHPSTIGAMVHAVQAMGLPVIVVDDGSDTKGAQAVDALRSAPDITMTLLRLPVNGGKGNAMLAGFRLAQEQGYSHVLQIDADGQHEAGDIPRFLALARQYPQAVICGVPVYDDSVPKSRLYGRYVTHVWVWINTLSLEIRDSMCGFRLYPLAAVSALTQACKLGRRMDFDTDILVRLVWRGVRVVNLETRVVYPADGISHFRLARDNVQISLMHARLFAGMLLRLPRLLWCKVMRHG